MSPRLRLLVPALLVALVVGAGVLLANPFPTVAPHASAGATNRGSGGPGSGTDGSGGPGGPSGGPPADQPTPRPEQGGTELYGFLPYWQMSDSMATYLRSAELSTLTLFSVSARRSGALNTRDIGYSRIIGAIGRRLIDEAHARGTRVELGFTSFGGERNGILFGRLAPSSSAAPSPLASPAAPVSPAAPAPWHRTVVELVALAADLGVDGINVDVELLDPDDRGAYGEFLAALRGALVAALPDAQVSVDTEAGPRGVANAAEASAAGVDRLFLMGYDYHWSGSAPGASSPIDRSDGLYSLRWSIDRYVEAGVPRDRIILGLPLYGMSWQTTGPDRTAPVIGRGSTWVPAQHLDVLLSGDFRAGRDVLEVADFFVTPDGDNWRVTYFDSPGTLRQKLALARDNGLAGAGFWALDRKSVV